MPSIVDYLTLVKLVLAESGKYFSLLLFSVLAIRLWRNCFKSSGVNKLKNLLLAVCVSVLAYGIGVFSIRNSMGILYSHYGMEAFKADRLEQAYSLFETSSEFWPGADATGGQGICLLLSGRADAGEALLQKACAMRKGKNSTFEQFFRGLYYFMQNEPDKALPLLEDASADPQYRWSVVKFLAVMELDKNHPEAAAELMKPFMRAVVTESDQAYIIASLKLAGGKKAEAKALVDEFSTTNLPTFWKSRFDKLQAQINSR
jgi:tetratricopeptide (TPR) repeat protein